MKTKVYGASDDLIEIEGNVSDEIGCYNNTTKRIQGSDGTVAKIEYDGNWHISIKETGLLFEKIVLGNPAEEPHTDIDAIECSPYSDVLVFKEGIEWVKIGLKKIKK